MEVTVDKVLYDILCMNEAESLSEIEPLIRSLNHKLMDLKGLGVNLKPLHLMRICF